MAASMTTASTVKGLGGSSLSPNRTCLSSGFVKPIVVGNPLRQVRASGGRFTCSFQRDWLRRDLNVIGFGLTGRLAPSSIPLIDGKSLTGLFFESLVLNSLTSLHLSCSHFSVLVVADNMALGAFHHPYLWADWIQGED